MKKTRKRKMRKKTKACNKGDGGSDTGMRETEEHCKEKRKKKRI